MMMKSKITLPSTAIATRYSTRYSNFLLLLDSNSTRSQKPLLAGAWSPGVWISEPGHDLGGIAADVIFSTKHNPDTLNILPTFKVQIQGV